MMTRTVWILWLIAAVDAGKDDSLSGRFSQGVEELYRKSEILQEKALTRASELQERAEEIQTKALKKAEMLERQAVNLLDRTTRQAQDLQRKAATQLGELQATIESLPTGSQPSSTESADATESIAGSLSQSFSRAVEELYQKAEVLQEKASKRILELQEQAETIQSESRKTAKLLERQAESLLDRATRQAQNLQREAATQLGELQATIENLPIPPPPALHAKMQRSLQDVTESSDGTQDTPDIFIPSPPPLEESVQVTVDEATTAEDISRHSGYAPPLEESVQVSTVAPTSKWDNLRERTLPAILMLGALTAYIHFGGSMIPLIFLIQVGLYAETSAAINVKGWLKWWWFSMAVAATNGRFLHWKFSEAIAYGMAAIGLAAWVIQNNLAGHVEAFMSNLATLAATHLSLLFLVGQSSFWIATLQEFGLTWILYPAFLVMINDTMAYIFGMLMGKHPLLPIISPKKTWEGFLGATVSTLAVSQPLLKLMDSGDWQHALVMGTFVSLVSPFGGFLASIVKRAHGKKDFATWIPGHGGVVDRLDCQVMTAPFVYLYLTYFMTKTTEGVAETLASSL